MENKDHYRVENIVRKGEIAYYKQSLFFSQCFPQLYIFSASKCGNLCKWFKIKNVLVELSLNNYKKTYRSRSDFRLSRDSKHLQTAVWKLKGLWYGREHCEERRNCSIFSFPLHVFKGRLSQGYCDGNQHFLLFPWQCFLPLLKQNRNFLVIWNVLSGNTFNL